MSWQLLGERRAVALFMLGFSTTIFIIIALSMGGDWAKCFSTMAIVYGVAFFGVASGWFWARWYAMGIAGSGITMAILGLATNGWNASLVIWGGIHLLIYLPLVGESMADYYENREDWRERYNLDEHGVARIQRAVKGAATALPTLVFYALAPRQNQMTSIALVLVASLGFVGLLRMRFWGVALLGIAAVWSAISSLFILPAQWVAISGGKIGLSGVGVIATVALLVAVSPFILPTWRTLRGKKIKQT